MIFKLRYNQIYQLKTTILIISFNPIILRIYNRNCPGDILRLIWVKKHFVYCRKAEQGEENTKRVSFIPRGGGPTKNEGPSERFSLSSALAIYENRFPFNVSKHCCRKMASNGQTVTLLDKKLIKKLLFHYFGLER